MGRQWNYQNPSLPNQPRFASKGSTLYDVLISVEIVEQLTMNRRNSDGGGGGGGDP